MRFRLCFRLCLGLILLLVAQPAFAFDFSGWDALLKKYVAPKTIDGVRLSAVNYQKLGQDPIYKMLIKDLEGNSISQVTTRE